MASTETFSTGANRNDATNQIDPEGFFSPEVLQVYCDYMHKNRFRPNGEFRDSDNWQLGIPQFRYMKSLWRHFFSVWTLHRKVKNNLPEPSPYRNEKLLEDCCGVLFNTFGYMFEELKKPTRKLQDEALPPQTGLSQFLNREARERWEKLQDRCDFPEKDNWQWGD